jgi:hypothetical protein
LHKNRKAYKQASALLNAEVRGMKEVWKIQKENEAQFVATTPDFEEFAAPSWGAFLEFLRDFANEHVVTSITIFSPRPGQLTVRVEDLPCIHYYVLGDYDVQVLRVKRYYLARGYELYAFETEDELKAKLQELGIPYVTPP